jgi:hypothetical protein
LRKSTNSFDVSSRRAHCPSPKESHFMKLTA